MDGKGLDPFNHHFLSAGTKPPLTGWKRTSIFLLGFIQCQKAFTASARVLSMQRQRPGRAGGWPAPPSSHPAPGGDTPQTTPPQQGQRATAAGERDGGQGGGFPSSGLILLGSSTAQRWLGPGLERGQADCVCVPLPAAVGSFEPNLSVLARKRRRQVLASPTAPGTQLSIPPAKRWMHPSWKGPMDSQLTGTGGGSPGLGAGRDLRLEPSKRHPASSHPIPR